MTLYALLFFVLPGVLLVALALKGRRGLMNRNRGTNEAPPTPQELDKERTNDALNAVELPIGVGFIVLGAILVITNGSISNALGWWILGLAFVASLVLLVVSYARQRNNPTR
jgi:hypothetical protein